MSDKTGLVGNYNFRVEWQPDKRQPNGAIESGTSDVAVAPISAALKSN